MSMGMENPLLLMSWNFEFYYLQRKNPVLNSKILVFSLMGMRVQCSFSIGDEILRCFSHRGRIFWPSFPVRRVFPSGQ